MKWSVLSLFAVAACNSGGGEPPGAVAMHELHEAATPVIVPMKDDDFYALPFPNALRVEADGTVDLRRFPRAFEPGTLVHTYIETIDADLRGFGMSSGIYFRFDAAIDDKTLPADANASTQAGATAYVVDITPGSPSYGKKSPV